MKPNLLVVASLLLVAPTVVFSQPETVKSAPPAPESDDPSAVFERARAFLAGKGVPKDEKKAFELMKSAADQGHADAIGGLGYFYSVGLVIPKDEKLALEWFRKGAEKGSAKAQLNLGNRLLRAGDGFGNASEKDRSEGLLWLKKAADQNLPEACMAYGSILFSGEYGLATDYDSAARYMKIAVAADIAAAQNIMGMMSHYGWGVPVDKVMAEQWFRKAALKGDLKAQSNLGSILGPLSEDKQTRLEALAWLVIASDQGEITAIKELEDTVPGLKNGEMDGARVKALELRKLIPENVP